MEGRTENFTPGGQIRSWGQSLPLGVKLRMGLWYATEKSAKWKFPLFRTHDGSLSFRSTSLELCTNGQTSGKVRVFPRSYEPDLCSSLITKYMKIEELAKQEKCLIMLHHHQARY
jgi:hypothetical protein